MEKQILYVRVNEDITSRVVFDSPVDIEKAKKILDTLSKVNEQGSQEVSSE